MVGVRGFLERDISSLRTVAGEGPTQNNDSRHVAAAVVAPWKGYLGSMHKFIRKIHNTDIFHSNSAIYGEYFETVCSANSIIVRKYTKRTHVLKQVQCLVNILKLFGVLTPY